MKNKETQKPTNLEEMLRNRFDMSRQDTGFCDRFSHMLVTVPHNAVALERLVPRGLREWWPWGSALSPKLLSLALLTADGEGGVYAYETEYLPWVVRQKGVFSVNGREAKVQATLVSNAFNRLLWRVEIEGLEDFSVVLSGRTGASGVNHIVKPLADGVKSVFITGVKQNKKRHNPQVDGTRPHWVLRSAQSKTAEVDGNAYRLVCKPELCGGKHVIEAHIEYDNVLLGREDEYKPLPLPVADVEKIARERAAEWTAMLGSAAEGRGDRIKKIRCAAGLIRCGYQWRATDKRPALTPLYTSASDTFSWLFFWDSLFACASVLRFNPRMAESSIRALYSTQRKDGCVATATLENVLNDTFYPQAPLLGWALVQLWASGKASSGFISEMLKKEEELFGWFTRTQDHDADGLPEWRFSGCPADDSPLYDQYVILNGTGTTCTYLPPVASVGLASYLIMDAKCMAFLYAQNG